MSLFRLQYCTGVPKKALQATGSFLATIGWGPPKGPWKRQIVVGAGISNHCTFLPHHTSAIFLPKENVTIIGSPLRDWTDTHRYQMFKVLRETAMMGSVACLVTAHEPDEKDRFLCGFPNRIWIYDSPRKTVQHSWFPRDQNYPTLLGSNPDDPSVFQEFPTWDPQEVESHLMYDSGMDDPAL
jgi:hypothetical protein